MRVRITVVLMAIVALLVPALGAGAKPPEGKPEKVSVCHVPPGNPANEHMISISDRALDAHLAHGDYLGVCKNARPNQGDQDAKYRPVADAGLDRCVPFDDRVYLDGSDSRDPDGKFIDLDFEWSFLDRPVGSGIDSLDLSNDEVADPYFDPDQFGVYELELEVTDDDNLSDTDRVKIEVYMEVSLDKSSYDVDEGETTPVVISLNERAPRDLTVYFDIDEDEAVVVLDDDDDATDAVTQAFIDKGDDEVTVYLYGVEDLGTQDEETTLEVWVGTTSICGDRGDSAEVDVDDDTSQLSSSLPFDFDLVVRRMISYIFA
jgi:hypothetical protein